MKRILFVDDDSNILDGIRRMLRADRNRWEIQFAIGGEAALRSCEAGAFDIVFSDMRMPGMDGATFLGHIRDRFPATARCILSGYSEVELTIRALPVAHRVLSKPCRGAQLQATIERICTLQDVLCTPELRPVMGSIGELPSLPSTLRALTRAVQAPDAQVKTVAKLIAQDIAITAKVLQIVNSGFFGLGQRITNLECAVQFLGMETIKTLALDSEAFKEFGPGARVPHSVYETMQEHAQRTAAIAATLSIGSDDRDIAIVSALLHDIGSLILACKIPDQFSSILTYAKNRGCKPVEVEEELLGITHAEIGAYLLGLWGIDNLVVESIAHHHRPDRIPHAGVDGCVALYVADLLAREIEHYPLDAEEIQLDESDRACLKRLGILHEFSGFRARALQCLR